MTATILIANRTKTIVALALTIALVAVTGAQASRTALAPTLIQLRVGDKVVAAGSNVGCYVASVGVMCMKQAQSAPAGKLVAQKGSYITALMVGGKMSVVFKENGSAWPTNVFERTPYGHGLRMSLDGLKVSRIVHLRQNQGAQVTGSPFVCANLTTGASAASSVYCSWNAQTGGPVPGTYTEVVSNNYAAVGKVAGSQTMNVLFNHAQP